MNNDRLMELAVGVMIPLRYRDYFLVSNEEDWEKKTIPKEEGDDFILYHEHLDELTANPSPDVFRAFIESHKETYLKETGGLLELNDKELVLILDAIRMEKMSKGLEFKA